MSLPKLNPTLSKLRDAIFEAYRDGARGDEIVTALVWGIDAIEGNWAIADSEVLHGRLAWILSEFPYDTSE